MSGADNYSETTRTVSGSTTITGADYNLLVIGATGAVAVTLPDASTIPSGRAYRVYKDAAAFAVTITPAAGTIDGGANTTLAASAIHAKELISDGDNWFVLSAY